MRLRDSRIVGASLTTMLVLVGASAASAGPSATHSGTATVRSDAGDALHSDGAGPYTSGANITDESRGSDEFRLVIGGDRRLRLNRPVQGTCEKPGLSYLMGSSKTLLNWFNTTPVGGATTGNAIIACTVGGVDHVIKFGECVTISHESARAWRFSADASCTANHYSGNKMKLVGPIAGGAPFDVVINLTS